MCPGPIPAPVVATAPPAPVVTTTAAAAVVTKAAVETFDVVNYRERREGEKMSDEE
jgi:hypothetical protein